MLGAMAGADPADPTASRRPVPNYVAELGRSPRGVRIGLDEAYVFENLDDASTRAVNEVLETMTELGANVVAIEIPRVREIATDWLPSSGVEMASAHVATYPARADAYGSALSGLIELGRSETAIDYFQRQMRRLEFRGLLEGLFEFVDVLLIPTLSPHAPTVEEMAKLGEDPEDLLRLIRFTAPSDMSGNPAVVLPGYPDDDGRPVSFQFVGRHFDEGLVLSLAHSYQRVTDWHLAEPPAE
jgi:amidase